MRQLSPADHNYEASESQPFVLGRYVFALVDAYCASGASLEDLAAATGLGIHSLYAPPEKVAVETYFALIQAAKTITADPLFGVSIGGAMTVNNFDVLGQAMVKAESLGQATVQVIALEGLVHRLGYSELVTEPEGVRYIWHNHYQRHPLAPELSESVLVGIVKFAATLLGRSIPLLEATFIHESAADVKQDQYTQALGGSCLFGQTKNSLLVANEVLAWPVLANNRAENLEASVANKHGKHSPHIVSTQLQQHLEKVLHKGNPQLAEVAECFHMSPRTLQRRLKKEGGNFQQILNELRCRLATDYLRYSTLSLYDISRFLGFAEQSSFNHFFLAHFGQPPQSYKLDTI